MQRTVVARLSPFNHDRIARIKALTWVRWEHVGFVLSGALALALTTWRLTANGYGNLYYAAAVKSMANNPHAWFFASLDPSGFISIDKPPFGFWIQVVSVWLFGFSPLAVLLPQALAGAIAPPLLGVFLRRFAAARAAVIAAFALALTPIWIVSARDNIVDVLLALALLLAIGALLKALSVSTRATSQSARNWWNETAWLALAFALVGIGFNIKMLEAYLVVPALAITYLLCARRPVRRRIGTLLLALVVMVVVSFSWVEAVDHLPATARPYVGSTSTNSELDLAIGYNGLHRFLGMNTQANGSIQFSTPAPSQRIGEPGPFRMLQPELGAQVSWLVPLALLGLIVAWPFTWPRAGAGAPSGTQSPIPMRDDAESPAQDQPSWPMRQAGYLAFAIWMLTGLAFFSIARYIDTYYLVVIAPPLCAMAGFGLAPLFQDQTAPRWHHRLVLLTITLTLGEQAYLMTHAAPHWATWPVWVALGAGAAGAFGLLVTWASQQILARLSHRQRNAEAVTPVDRPSAIKTPTRPRFQAALLALLLLTCFVTPGLWTAGSLTPGNAGSHPIAGPQYAHGGPKALPHGDPQLMRYLNAHRGGAMYLVATRDSGASTPIIVSTTAPIMTLGGFSGNDPTLTPAALYNLIMTNQIHFFLLPANYVTSGERAALYSHMFPGKKGSLPGPKYMNGGPLYHWIATACIPVPPPLWSSDRSARTRLGKLELFDCVSPHKPTARTHAAGHPGSVAE